MQKQERSHPQTELSDYNSIDRTLMRKGEEEQDSAEEVEEARLPARTFDEPQNNLQTITPASEAPWTDPSSVSDIGIGSVKDLIQVYLQQGLNKDEVAAILSVQNGIHPGITHRAWNRLKEEKPKLFNDYIEKLIMRQMSNLSLDQQHQLPPAKSPPLARPILGFSQNMLGDLFGTVNTLDEGDTIKKQRMVTDSKAADIPSLPPFKKPRISNPASVTYNDQTRIMSQFGANTDGKNFLEQQGPGSGELRGVKENSASVALFASQGQSTKADQHRNLSSSDPQSEEEY